MQSILYVLLCPGIIFLESWSITTVWKRALHGYFGIWAIFHSKSGSNTTLVGLFYVKTTSETHFQSHSCEVISNNIWNENSHFELPTNCRSNYIDTNLSYSDHSIFFVCLILWVKQLQNLINYSKYISRILNLLQYWNILSFFLFIFEHASVKFLNYIYYGFVI